jgi:hypothetical protein
LEQFKKLFTQRNPDAEVFSKAWILLKGIDALPDEDSHRRPPEGSAAMPHGQGLSRPQPLVIAPTLSEKPNSLPGFARLQEHLEIAYNLVRAGNVFSAWEEMGQVIRQAYRKGCTLRCQYSHLSTADNA